MCVFPPSFNIFDEFIIVFLMDANHFRRLLPVGGRKVQVHVCDIYRLCCLETERQSAKELKENKMSASSFWVSKNNADISDLNIFLHWDYLQCGGCYVCVFAMYIKGNQVPMNNIIMNPMLWPRLRGRNLPTATSSFPGRSEIWTREVSMCRSVASSFAAPVFTYP